MATKRIVVWRPRSHPQAAFVACPAFEIFYGGARGGGKSDASIGINAIRAGRYGKAYRGLFLRRELTQLEDAIARAKEVYLPLGADWQEQKKTFTFPGGGVLRFRYLDRDADAERYQGWNLTDISIEELTNFPDPRPIFKLMATLRSADGVPCQFRATGNPGGPGHQWVKARYIDPAPQGYKPLTDPDTGKERVFIPAKVWDNRPLMEAQGEDYIANLKAAAGGSDALLRAWLHGDWDVIEGAFFDNWDAAKHVVKPIQLPDHWLRYRAFDWGSAVPFSCHWLAVSDGTMDAFPNGALVVYREWYGMAEGKPNVGLKLTAEEIADGVLRRQQKG